MSGFRMVIVKMAAKPLAWTVLYIKTFFSLCIKWSRLIVPFENRTKSSGFRMNPVFNWSDFGSLLYINCNLGNNHEQPFKIVAKWMWGTVARWLRLGSWGNEVLIGMEFYIHYRRHLESWLFEDQTSNGLGFKGELVRSAKTRVPKMKK